MFHYEGAPIFICGNQRSGTRMVAKILSTHSRIVITDETLVLPDLSRIIEKIDSHPQNKEWREQRSFAAARFLIDTSGRHVRQKAKVARRFGNKTPRMELNRNAVEHLFPGAVYVYCVRHPAKVLRSLKNMPWNRYDAATNLNRYKKSIAAYDAMREEVPTFIVQIDKIRDEVDQISLVNSLCDFIGEKPDDGIMSFASRRWQPENTIKAPLSDLSEEDMQALYRDHDYRDICERFGYESD